MYKKLESFYSGAGKVVLYQAVPGAASNSVKNTKYMIAHNKIFCLENIVWQRTKHVAKKNYILVIENYTTKEFQVRNFKSEKQATQMWYDSVQAIRQFIPTTKQR